ncbi:MAG TPA: hypothetical protein VG122_05545 [Gemmata sp.]|nr:hypothetical protein [Gemmata sp.]
MRRPAIIPLVLICATVVFAGVTQATPEWSKAAGLDFWNLSREEAQLRAATTRREELNAQCERVLRRMEVAEHIAAALCEDRLTLSEAIEGITTLAGAAPEWFAQLRDSYHTHVVVSPTATDRDVVFRYLLLTIEMMRLSAELQGDTTRTIAISARLVQLEGELPQSETCQPNVTAAQSISRAIGRCSRLDLLGITGSDTDTGLTAAFHPGNVEFLCGTSAERPPNGADINLEDVKRR